MADISKIKANGVTYDIKDIESRNSIFFSTAATWDGNTVDKEILDLGDGIKYCRIGDAINLDANQYMFSDSMSLTRMNLSNPMEDILMMKFMTFGAHVNLLTSGISTTSKFKELFMGSMGDTFNEFLDSNPGVLFGIHALTMTITFVNVPTPLVLPKELVAYAFGIDLETDITVPAGLWSIYSEDPENELVGYCEHIYIASPTLSKLVDNDIETLEFMFPNGLNVLKEE